MFYDLNVPWPSTSANASSSSSSSSSAAAGKKKPKPAAGAPQQATPSDPKGKATSNGGSTTDPLSSLGDAGAVATLTELTHDLASLGYSTIAYNLNVNTRFDPTVHANPFAPTPEGKPTVAFPALDPRTSAPPSSSSSSSSSSSAARAATTATAIPGQSLTQLSRLTLTLTEASLQPPGHGMLTSHATALMSYDLLSVQPTSEATFQHACLTLSELRPFAIDIISLDLASTPRLPWLLRRTTINAALENGVMFEVCYSSALSSSTPGSGAAGGGGGGGDASAHLKSRRNLIANTRDLLRITNGRGVIFSSGAMSALALRGPYDVVNLANVFGMSPQAARDAVSENPRQLIVRARTRKSYRGVVGPPVVLAAASQTEAPLSAPAATSAASATRKRKQVDGDGDGNGDETPRGEAQPAAPSQQPPKDKGKAKEPKPAGGSSGGGKKRRLQA